MKNILAWLVLALATIQATAQTTQTPEQIIGSWDTAISANSAALKSTDTNQTDTAIETLRALKGSLVGELENQSTNATLVSSWLDELLPKVARSAPAALGSEDFEYTMLDSTGTNTVYLGNETTKQILITVRPDLAIYYLPHATSDAEESALITKYGTVDAVNLALISHPTWGASIKTACLHTTANHMTWYRLLPYLTNDTVRLQLAQSHKSDAWMQIAAYITAQTTAAQTQLAANLQTLGISIAELTNAANLAINANYAGTNAVTAANNNQAYWDSQTDDDDTQSMINNTFAQMRRTTTAFSNSLSKVTVSSQSDKQASNTAASFKNTGTALNQAWFIRGTTGGGADVNSSQITAMLTNPDMIDLIIEQGSANAQSALLDATTTASGCQLSADQLNLLCRTARDNQIIQKIAQLPLISKTRIAIINNVRHDALAAGILTTLLNNAPLNNDEITAIVKAGTTPSMLEQILSQYASLTTYQTVANCNYPQVVRICVQNASSDLTTVANAMKIQSLISFDNDTTTRNVIVQSSQYPTVYAKLGLGAPSAMTKDAANTAATLTSKTKTTATATTTGTDTTYQGTGIALTYAETLEKADQLFGQYVTAETTSAMNPTNITAIQAVFWPDPNTNATADTLNQLSTTTTAATTASTAIVANVLGNSISGDNTKMATSTYKVHIINDDGSASNLYVAYTNNTQLATAMTNAVPKLSVTQWNTAFTNGTLPSNSNQVNTINTQLQAALADAKTKTQTAAQASRQAQLAKAIAAQTALQNGDPSGMSLQAAINLLQNTKKQAAVDQSTWGARTDLENVTPDHPYYKAAQAEIGNQGPMLITKMENGNTTLSLNTGSTMLDEYNSDGTLNSDYTTAMAEINTATNGIWRYETQTATNTVLYYNLFQYMKDQWQNKYYGNAPTSIPSLEKTIATKADAATVQELTSDYTAVSEAAATAKTKIENMTPTKILQGTQAYKELTQDQLQSTYVGQTIINNQTIKYFDAFQYALDKWNTTYMGTDVGTPGYFQNLLISRSATK